jgi:hypothetical protein
VNDAQLVISYIRGERPTDDEELTEIAASFIHNELTHESKEDWIKSRMTHSQRLGLAAEQAKSKPMKEIVPKEHHGFLNTVFSEREIGILPKKLLMITKSTYSPILFQKLEFYTAKDHITIKPYENS